MSNHLLYPVYGFRSVLLRISQESTVYGSSQGPAQTGEITDVCITAEAAPMQLSDSSSICSSSITCEKDPEILLHLRQHLL